jgi:hypothetical protein
MEKIMTARDELEALATECLQKNNMDLKRVMKELVEIVSKRPDLLEVMAKRFLDHVLLVQPRSIVREQSTRLVAQ